MTGKLFIVEGASASGKNTLLEELVINGYTIMRGVASQDPEENRTLILRSRELLGDTVLNFKEVLRKPDTERDDIFRRFIKIAALQQEEAIRLKNEGEIVFLNRSAVSLITFIRLPLEISDTIKRNEWEKWTFKMLEEPMTLKAQLLDHLDGIILMNKASVGGKERLGTSGMQELESASISEETKRLCRVSKLPFVELNAAVLSVKEEVDRVKAVLHLKF